MLTGKYRHGLLALFVGVVLAFAIGALALIHGGRSVAQRVGFYSPGGLPAAVIKQTNIGVFNAVTPQQVDENLRQLGQGNFAATIDLGQVITRVVSPRFVGMVYDSGKGEPREKLLAPKVDGNVREFIPEAKLIAVLGPFLDVMANHMSHIDTVLLADEPYLNGIAKTELERVAALVRRELDARGLHEVRIGVVFASAMFDRDFARMLDAQAGIYVAAIDSQLSTQSAGSQEWSEKIRVHRLATYDRAGNMYVDGGLPRGFDVIGFDFYLSTLLLDGLHEHSLAWFAERYPSEDCNPFAGMTVSEVRKMLSFFQDGPVVQDPSARTDDDELLDSIYRCRMGSTTAMLKNAAAGQELDFLLVSESSSNGVLEFDPRTVIESGQPALLIESRVVDEVQRAQKFYLDNRCFYSFGLLYFTFSDAYDSAIKLNVGGVASMPSVKASIFRFATTVSGESVECGLRDYWSKMTGTGALSSGRK